MLATQTANSECNRVRRDDGVRVREMMQGESYERPSGGKAWQALDKLKIELPSGFCEYGTRFASSSKRGSDDDRRKIQ